MGLYFYLNINSVNNKNVRANHVLIDGEKTAFEKNEPVKTFVKPLREYIF